MGNVNASALTALQSRMNTERVRRGLSTVSFTDGVAAGSPILATHFIELHNTTESLDTLSSQTFNWSGTVAAGASITDVLPQIDSYLTTLENEVLASWKSLSPLATYYGGGTNSWTVYDVPVSARPAGNFRWTVTSLTPGDIQYIRWAISSTPDIPNVDNFQGRNTGFKLHEGTPNTLGGKEMNVYWWPWVGDVGDATPGPLQTPYQINNKTYAYETEHGVISGYWSSSDSYVCSLNHTYSSVIDFTSTKRYAVVVALNPGAGFNVNVEAYY